MSIKTTENNKRIAEDSYNHCKNSVCYYLKYSI